MPSRIEPNLRPLSAPTRPEKSADPAPAAPAPQAAPASVGWQAGKGGSNVNGAIGSAVIANAAAGALAKGAGAIVSLSKNDLVAATTDQKIAMTRALLENMPAPGGRDGGNQERNQFQQALGQLAGSVPSAIEFDRLFYSVDGNALINNSGAMSSAIERRVHDNLAATTPGDWGSFNQFLDQVTGTRATKSNSLQFMVDGPDVTAAFKKDLEAATRSVDISVFQWQPDQEVGWPLAKALSEKAKAGVSVRVLLDEKGSLGGADREEGEKMIASMREAGVQVIVNPNSLTSDHLDHRKVAVFDDKVAYTGGMNIGKSYQVDWHDQQTRVEGPAVSDLHSAFRTRWGQEGGKPQPMDTEPPASRPVANGIEARVVAHTGDHQDAFLKATYLKAISTAEKSIKIANPYFTDPDVAQALCAAAKRGVDVQVVLPKQNDMDLVQRASRAMYPELIKAGVGVYEYTGKMAHQKVATIDGTFSTFGSSNLDARSLQYNDEMNMVSLDPSLAKSIEQKLFAVDLSKSERITHYEPSLRELIDRRLRGLL